MLLHKIHKVSICTTKLQVCVYDFFFCVHRPPPIIFPRRGTMMMGLSFASISLSLLKHFVKLVTFIGFNLYRLLLVFFFISLLVSIIRFLFIKMKEKKNHWVSSQCILSCAHHLWTYTQFLFAIKFHFHFNSKSLSCAHIFTGFSIVSHHIVL